MLASTTIPNATASPCSSALYDVTVSSGWASAWPNPSVRRESSS